MKTAKSDILEEPHSIHSGGSVPGAAPWGGVRSGAEVPTQERRETEEKERASRREVWMVPQRCRPGPYPCGLAPRGVLDRTQAAGFPCSRGAWSSCGGSLQHLILQEPCLLRTGLSLR